MTMRRSLLPLVAEIARTTAYEDTEEAISGPDLRSEAATAPSAGSWARLSAPAIVEDSLELVAPDGSAYLPYEDFVEDPATGSFKNLRIPAGESLTAEYYAEEAYTERWRSLVLYNGWADTAAGAGEPAAYREGSRVYLRGVIGGGTAAVGTMVFSVPGSHSPGAVATLPTMTDAGPIVIDIFPDGAGEIGDGPFEAGNGWLALDGLSWAWEAGEFTAWGDLAPILGELDEITFSALDYERWERAAFTNWGEDVVAFAELTQTTYGGLN